MSEKIVRLFVVLGLIVFGLRGILPGQPFWFDIPLFDWMLIILTVVTLFFIAYPAVMSRRRKAGETN